IKVNARGKTEGISKTSKCRYFGQFACFSIISSVVERPIGWVLMQFLPRNVQIQAFPPKPGKHH
ncbi:MAG: hypothetical protein KDJ51_06580, partial [Nitratireductor sp.]|nr:hypothetical protein [Nitratireductor sp.]